MKNWIVALSFVLFTPLFCDSPETYLEGRIPKNNGRYETFFEALRLMKERNVQVIVETGTERWLDVTRSFDGDGGSTIIFGHFATNNQATMYSVDINETHLGYCQDNALAFLSHLTLVLQDSVDFLAHFPEKIDFLYLDSYDYTINDPLPAQHHCLNEIKAAEDKLTKRSIIMIDDCNVPGGGKGKLAIDYLLNKGWHLHKNRHQVILLQDLGS